MVVATAKSPREIRTLSLSWTRSTQFSKAGETAADNISLTGLRAWEGREIRGASTASGLTCFRDKGGQLLGFALAARQHGVAAPRKQPGIDLKRLPMVPYIAA